MTPTLEQLGTLDRAWQSRSKDPVDGSDALIGLCAQVIDDDDESFGSSIGDYFINNYSGLLFSYENRSMIKKKEIYTELG